ncbi:MAG TPA: aminotransferase class III-fold pyridoxal phosphate-dependent enzyme, partial [Niabella sp.]|nr:aminotransferase class III-fold pyridoxal phosphate-dependent enzyme [Niabella sp.]
MNLFDVYPLNNVTITKAKGSYVWDSEGNQYLDLYGGHAVIYICHNHPPWGRRIEEKQGKNSFFLKFLKKPFQAKMAK